jgi:hypothetical protein
MSQNDDLGRLLDALDQETRARWGKYLEEVDAEIEEKGPAAAREHLESALKHLLAVGYAVHRCYSQKESAAVMNPIGDAAAAVEYAKGLLDQLSKKPEWSQ